MERLQEKIKKLSQKPGVYSAPFKGLKSLPKKCGIYLFKNKSGKIIYIGKASNLRNRVSSYWQKGASLSPAKQKMLVQVEKIDFEATDSEIEALLLEANLIKKHRPRFNVILRDDKSFTYIAISTEEEYPRVYTTRQIKKKGKYFGPFVSSGAVKETLKVLRRFLPFRSCRVLPRRPCLYYQINRCPGPCVKAVTKEEYQKVIKQIILFLQGKNSSLIKKLTSRDQLNKIDKVLAHTKVISWLEKAEVDLRELARIFKLPKEPKRIEGYDISNIVGQSATGAMVVFVNGEADKSEYRKFKIKLDGKPNDVAMMREMFERRFLRIKNYELGIMKKETWPRPDLIIVDGGKAQLNVAVKVLKRYKLDIPVISIAKRNEEIYFPDQKEPLKLPRTSPALHLIMRVRDETHRFAIQYHKFLRKKKMLK